MWKYYKMNRTKKAAYKKTIINTFGSAFDLFGIDWPNLNLEQLLQKAQKSTGYYDFGKCGFIDNLSLLLNSAKKEADLTALGKWSLYHEIIDLLCSRLTLYNEFNKNPEAFRKEITRPLFITGLPRTGTTILQTLLAQDPQLRTPLAWEYHLAPDPPSIERGKNQKRINRCQNGLDVFKSFIPQFDQMHPLEAELPQECIMGMAINFDSGLFELKYHIPSYQKWYNNNHKTDTYGEHKMLLQYLQKNIPTNKWLLKAPTHIANLPELFEIYTDALVVQTHRDVKKALPSVTNLYYQVRKTFSNTVQKNSIGKEAMEQWSKRLNKGMTYRAEHPENEGRFFDLDFADLMKDPLGIIQKLYAYFNMELTENTLQNMKAFLNNNHRGKHGKHIYSLEKFGIEETDFDKNFGGYSNRFMDDGKNYI